MLHIGDIPTGDWVAQAPQVHLRVRVRVCVCVCVSYVWEGIEHVGVLQR